MRADGAGIGKRQADLKTKTRGRVVESKNLQRIVLLGDDNAGMLTRVLVISQRGVAARELAFDAVDGQARQP